MYNRKKQAEVESKLKELGLGALQHDCFVTPISPREHENPWLYPAIKQASLSYLIIFRYLTCSMDQDEAVKNISFQSDKTRRQILLSYWIVVLLAVPLWWSTTSIARLPLPEERVRSLRDKKVSLPHAAREVD